MLASSTLDQAKIQCNTEEQRTHILDELTWNDKFNTTYSWLLESLVAFTLMLHAGTTLDIRRRGSNAYGNKETPQAAQPRAREETCVTYTPAG